MQNLCLSDTLVLRGPGRPWLHEGGRSLSLVDGLVNSTKAIMSSSTFALHRLYERKTIY